MAAERPDATGLFSTLLEHAIELSAQWHDRTYRKGRWRDPAFDLPTQEVLRVPVVAHVTAVALIVQRAGWEDEVIAAAFLHDVIEDGNRFGEAFRYEELQALVGVEVADLVREVSEPQIDAQGRPRGWHDRKQSYVRGLKAASDQAVAISLADKLHNLWSINETLLSGIDVFTRSQEHRGLSAGPEDQAWFYRSVLELSTERGDPRLSPMRTRLSDELVRFERLALGSAGEADGPPAAEDGSEP